MTFYTHCVRSKWLQNIYQPTPKSYYFIKKMNYCAFYSVFKMIILSLLNKYVCEFDKHFYIARFYLVISIDKTHQLQGQNKQTNQEMSQPA